MTRRRSSRLADPGDVAALFLCLLAALMLWLAAGFMWQARAHSWYEPSCCSARDCVELPPKAVTVTRNGYAVAMVINDVPHRFTIAQAEARHSLDEHFHICLVPTPGGEQLFGMRCFYAPPLGT